MVQDVLDRQTLGFQLRVQDSGFGLIVVRDLGLRAQV